ncbi:MAG: hypothetical protein HY658_04140 [Actinobacteria bacterium]|nr:hypothetical protein [Actinomycetota bacterium]
MAATVVYTDEDPNGLAEMLGGLIEANLSQHPERERLLRPATIGILAPDAEVGVTIRLAPGRVTMSNGLAGPPPHLLVRAPSETLIELSAVPLKLGLPDLLTSDGRAVNRKLLKGEIKVRGMYRHLGKLARFNKLLSVNG